MPAKVFAMEEKLFCCKQKKHRRNISNRLSKKSRTISSSYVNTKERNEITKGKHLGEKENLLKRADKFKFVDLIPKTWKN